ncbi:hypothetical protein WUBG_01699 [Wuchereria bancrofti]|uniref:Uncharacterized protein n=1 Tax=Wuchereria bancrofti TaxID=6293 RepID=J9FJ81_WUCBA|nr:hypothetical protein WUBG_01699 [Wuchereria bancrofti]
MVPIYGKGKSGAFSMLAGQDSDDDNTEKEGSISENSNKADEIEESKQGKTNMKARDKPNEAKELSKQQTGLKKDDDLDALLADLEKPVEKVSKEKRKKEQFLMLT